MVAPPLGNDCAGPLLLVLRSASSPMCRGFFGRGVLFSLYAGSLAERLAKDGHYAVGPGGDVRVYVVLPARP